MQFDIGGMGHAQAYKLLASVVVPRPIAFVTSVDAGGRVNAAPFSFFNMIGYRPPLIALGVADRGEEPGNPKDTRANIATTGEFVVNLVDEALAKSMNICAVDFPPEIDELEQAHLTPIPGVRVAVPRIAESPVSLECRLAQIVSVGENRIILGEVVFLHIRDDVVDTERLHVRTDALNLIGRMHGGGWYARTSDLFDMPRIPYAEWQHQHRTTEEE